MDPREYVKLAEVEDRMWYFWSLHRHVWRELRRHLPADRAMRVLDAGCGTGGLLARLRNWAPKWELTGVDVSPQACRYARQRTAANVVEASVTDLPFASETFDAVLLLDVLAHVAEDTRALADVARCLRPGAVLVLVAPVYPWLWSYHDLVTHTLRRYRVAGLREQVERSGLSVAFETHLNALPLPLLVLRRKLWRWRTTGASDVQAYPAPIEWGFRRVLSLEHAWIQRGWRLPFGSSIFIVARKSAGDAPARLPKVERRP